MAKRRGPVKGQTPWVKAKPRGWYPPSLVEDVIRDFCEGNAALFQREIEQRSGKKVSKQQVLGWRARGQFPPEFVSVIHQWTRIPFAKLIARTRPRS